MEWEIEHECQGQGLLDRNQRAARRDQILANQSVEWEEEVLVYIGKRGGEQTSTNGTGQDISMVRHPYVGRHETCRMSGSASICRTVHCLCVNEREGMDS